MAYTDRSSGAAAFAYYPGDYAVNGDIYFETEDTDIGGAGTDDFSTDGVGSAGFNYFAALHEIGHALGLSHPFDSGDDSSNGDDDLSLANGSMRNTVMSYVQLDQNYVLQLQNTGGTISTSPSYRIYASTPMLYDVAIMDALYGAESQVVNKSFRFTGTPQTLQTLVSASGTNSSINLSGVTRENIVNLTPGTFSSIGIYEEDDQITDLAATYGVTTTWLQSVVDGLDSAASAANSYYAATPRTALYTGQYNVAISDNTQIYLVSGSEQDDTIIGSGVRGHFVNTAGGDDLIISGGSTMAATGGDGNDVYQSGGGGGSFTGSAGIDVIVFSGNKADYTNYFTNNAYNPSKRR